LHFLFCKRVAIQCGP